MKKKFIDFVKEMNEGWFSRAEPTYENNPNFKDIYPALFKVYGGQTNKMIADTIAKWNGDENRAVHELWRLAQGFSSGKTEHPQEREEHPQDNWEGGTQFTGKLR